MSSAFLAIGSILIFLAGVFHVYVFFLESITWLKPKTWKTFGLPNQEYAQIIRSMAFNQGFYNLFLAIGIGVGLAVLGINSTVGYTLMFSSALSMVGAGIVLFLSVKTSRRAAIIQAGPPLAGSLLLFIGLAIR